VRELYFHTKIWRQERKCFIRTKILRNCFRLSLTRCFR